MGAGHWHRRFYQTRGSREGLGGSWEGFRQYRQYMQYRRLVRQLGGIARAIK